MNSNTFGKLSEMFITKVYNLFCVDDLLTKVFVYCHLLFHPILSNLESYRVTPCCITVIFLKKSYYLKSLNIMYYLAKYKI